MSFSLLWGNQPPREPAACFPRPALRQRGSERGDPTTQSPWMTWDQQARGASFSLCSIRFSDRLPLRKGHFTAVILWPLHRLSSATEITEVVSEKAAPGVPTPAAICYLHPAVTTGQAPPPLPRGPRIPFPSCLLQGHHLAIYPILPNFPSPVHGVLSISTTITSPSPSSKRGSLRPRPLRSFSHLFSIHNAGPSFLTAC